MTSGIWCESTSLLGEFAVANEQPRITTVCSS